MHRLFPHVLIVPALAILLALVLAGLALAKETPDEAAGRRLAERLCGECHATGLTGVSRLEDAPRFRVLHERFDLASLPAALRGGMLIGHARMPLTELDEDQLFQLTAYMTSLAPGEPAALVNRSRSGQ